MLVPSLATFLITIVNVAILFFVLRAVLFRPVTKFMDERTKKIEDAIAQAEKDKNQARLMLGQYEDQLKNAEGETDAIIRAARETAQQQAEKIVAEGREQSERFLANARKQLEAEETAAMARFRAEAAALVVAASSRLVQRDLSGEDNMRFAALLLREVNSSLEKNQLEKNQDV
jgi:F-type H+-transporting ATPase subunit b